ncbi:MAG: type II toxin-antitoxin system RelE/ParE family toxin [Geminicoccaceae bacterium]
MLAVRLPEEIEARLTALAERTGRSKSFYVREAVREHLDDLEDYYLAVQRLEERLPTVPLEERGAAAWAKIEFESRALKELEAQDRQVQRRLLAFLRDRVARWAIRASSARPLRGPDLGRFGWKYRVGDWRLVCEIRDRQVTVIVVRLGHRREIYGR